MTASTSSQSSKHIQINIGIASHGSDGGLEFGRRSTVSNPRRQTMERNQLSKRRRGYHGRLPHRRYTKNYSCGNKIVSAILVPLFIFALLSIRLSHILRLGHHLLVVTSTILHHLQLEIILQPNLLLTLSTVRLAVVEPRISHEIFPLLHPSQRRTLSRHQDASTLPTLPRPSLPAYLPNSAKVG
jgi:hypothetical protein